MSATGTPTTEIEVLFSAEERKTALREEARLGLTSTPKELQPKWFYDERGSELFDAITRLPEYYLTRAERSILERQQARSPR
jgi:L-histidine N-alpha-methyltransferase